MISRVRWVSVALLALLAFAVPCLADDAPAAATPAAAHPTTMGESAGFGGIGVQAGLGDVTSAEDYSKYGMPRMSFAAQWRYTFAHSWRWQLSPGFLWTAYNKRSNPAPFTDVNDPKNTLKDNYLALVAPVSTQLQWVRRGRTFTWHLGAGPGIYRVWVENHRKVVVDPVTFRPHRGVYVGGTAEIGAEHFFQSLSTTSLGFTLDGHYVNAKRDDQFPSGYNSALSGVGFRIGVNYYFNLHARPKKPADVLPGTAK